jgi:putative hydrolase of the HAD superfamily
MSDMIDLVAFDGDDTLWHNESIFTVTQQRYRELMAPYLCGDELNARLFAAETRNLRLFGYGVKSFTLSMIETAIEVSAGLVTASEIQAIMDAGRWMLEHPVELLDGVADAIDRVSASRDVMLITKGDLFDQESKLARSGLGDRFTAVEVVAEKDERTFARILDRAGVSAGRFAMVGNSARSDIAPVLALGGWAIHVPYPLTWAHESIDETDLRRHTRYRNLPALGQLPGVLAAIDSQPA